MGLRGPRDLHDIAVRLEYCSGQAASAMWNAEAIELGALMRATDRGAEIIRHRARAQGAGDLTRVVAARAVSHEIQAQIVAHEHGVFVVCATLPNIGCAARLEYELYRHLRAFGSVAGSRTCGKQGSKPRHKPRKSLEIRPAARSPARLLEEIDCLFLASTRRTPDSSEVVSSDARRAKPKTGLVLSGGGMRGAYEVGIVAGIMEVLDPEPGSGPVFQIFSGTSVGAINAT